MKGTTVVVAKRPNCDICLEKGKVTPAQYDAKLLWGPWAFLCENHFRIHTTKVLGTGIGQRLIVQRGEAK